MFSSMGISCFTHMMEALLHEHLSERVPASFMKGQLPWLSLRKAPHANSLIIISVIRLQYEFWRSINLVKEGVTIFFLFLYFCFLHLFVCLFCFRKSCKSVLMCIRRRPGKRKRMRGKRVKGKHQVPPRAKTSQKQRQSDCFGADSSSMATEGRLRS